jgi:spore coat polysaccharide biosynthesis predicted glycosyltransferase SpsG
LSYVIKAALKSSHNPDIYVSSEDEEILSLALKYGVNIHKRHPDRACDATTLDPVIYDAYKYASKHGGGEYDIIVTLQPTSPLITSVSIDNAIARIIENPVIDTVISAKDDTHLTWKKRNGRFLPNYAERVNRQYLSPIFKETGAFLVTRSSIITEYNRIGPHVDLYLLTGGESIDIDSFDDWSLCEYFLRKKRILFVVSGYSEIGLGHVYNTLLLANDILNHEIYFLVDAKSKLAFDKISERNYPVVMQKHADIIDDILLLGPHMVINDQLDTSSGYIQSLKKNSIKVINFEDLGEGAVYADMVINAIYPEKNLLPNHYFGHKYFCLRDEFLLSPKKIVTSSVKHVLLTFGGVDPNNYTYMVLKTIYDYCLQKNLQIMVIAGFGYNKYDTLKPFNRINIIRNSGNISDYMLKADVIFTSAGRTTYETAAIGTPTIVMAQNSRETTHFFASEEFGFLNLGLGTLLSSNDILHHFQKLVESVETRKYMGKLMNQLDLTKGRVNVRNLIYQLLGEI